MYLQVPMRRCGNQEQNVTAESKLAHGIQQITRHGIGFAHRLVDALHESRRRESARLIQRYRHVIDD